MADQFEFGIKLDADTRQAADMAGALEDVSSALDDAGSADLSGVDRELADTATGASDVERRLREAFEAGERGADKARLNNREFNGILRETRRYAEQSGKSLDDAFRDVQRAARDAGIELEDHTLEAMERMGRQGPDELDKVKAALRGLREESDDVADSVEQDARRMGDAFDGEQITPDDIFAADLRAELVSNMGETGAEVVRGFKDGFDSEDLETILDGVTDTMVSLGQMGGPAGTAAALAGGALVQAFAGPFLADAEARAEEFESIYASAFDAIVEHGAEMGRELAIQAATDELVQDTEKLAEAEDIAAASGAELAVVLRALAGDSDALALVQEQATEKERELKRARDAARESADRSSGSTVGLTEKERELLAATGDLSRGVDTLTERHNNATSAIGQASDAARAKAEVDAYAREKAIEHARAMASSTGEAQELTTTIEGVSTAIKVMPSGKIVKVDDDGTAKLTQRQIDKITGKSVTVGVDVDATNIESYIQGLSYRRPVLNVDVRHRRVGGPTP